MNKSLEVQKNLSANLYFSNTTQINIIFSRPIRNTEGDTQKGHCTNCKSKKEKIVFLWMCRSREQAPRFEFYQHDIIKYSETKTKKIAGMRIIWFLGMDGQTGICPFNQSSAGMGIAGLRYSANGWAKAGMGMPASPFYSQPNS